MEDARRSHEHFKIIWHWNREKSQNGIRKKCFGVVVLNW